MTKRCVWRYSKNPDDKNDKNWYILAFVNGKGSCSLRRFAAASGSFISKEIKKGDFQDNFYDWLNPLSIPLRLSNSIQLEKASKEGLPASALFEIKKQIIELATSALLDVLDR